MRNTMFLLMLLVLTGVSRVVLAGGVATFRDDPQVRVIQSGEIVKVIYVNSEVTDVKVSLFDEKGEKVFSETIRKQKDFIRPYNLSNLDEGIYKVAIECNEDTFTGQIACVHHEKTEATSEEMDSELLAHVSNVSGADNKERYLLSIPRAGNDDDKLTVTIFNEADYVLYKKAIHLSEDFARVYRIENQPGDIVIQITTEDGKMKRFHPVRNNF